MNPSKSSRCSACPEPLTVRSSKPREASTRRPLRRHREAGVGELDQRRNDRRPGQQIRAGRSGEPVSAPGCAVARLAFRRRPSAARRRAGPRARRDAVEDAGRRGSAANPARAGGGCAHFRPLMPSPSPADTAVAGADHRRPGPLPRPGTVRRRGDRAYPAASSWAVRCRARTAHRSAATRSGRRRRGANRLRAPGAGRRRCGTVESAVTAVRHRAVDGP
jgi:hypothetical protein